MSGGGERRACFISHRYADKEVLALCCARRLPGGLKPFVFDAVERSPDFAVTDVLMQHIRACERLVYLDTTLSLDSFWVGFERNYAARLGKPVYAFRPERTWFPFVRDRTPPIDPITSILFNLEIQSDLALVRTIGEEIWNKHRVDFRGVQWRRLDNEPRQMLDSIDDMTVKIAHGGIVLLFLSNASICSDFHDYADPSTFLRARKDFESPQGSTARRFAALPPARVQVVWLDQPDRARIDGALSRLDPTVWQGYVRIVRAALDDKNKCVAFQSGRPALDEIDGVLVRAFWLAQQADPILAAHFHSRFDKRPTILAPSLSARATDVRGDISRL